MMHRLSTSAGTRRTLAAAATTASPTTNTLTPLARGRRHLSNSRHEYYAAWGPRRLRTSSLAWAATSGGSIDSRRRCPLSNPAATFSVQATDDSPDGIPAPPTDQFADFFGEPVTFLDPPQQQQQQQKRRPSPSAAVEALDAHVVSVVSRGKSADGGGDDEGIPAKSAHSSAIAWAELLDRAREWDGLAPMLVAAAVSPLLAQAGAAYVRRVDGLLADCCCSSVPPAAAAGPIRMLPMARDAAAHRTSPALSPRERLHLRALHHLLRDEHRIALSCLQRLLHLCPGDALALSLAVDVSFTLADGRAALRAAASVASYWNERGRRSPVTNAVQPGHSIGTALIAVGYGAGGRYREAERLADEAMRRDDAGAGGVAAWALACSYDAEGRASEGTSLLSGYDGVQHYERCGHLFFDARLGGYGARFALDRDGAGAGRTAERMYGTAFERIVQYSAEAGMVNVARRAPKSRRRQMVEDASGAAKSVFRNWFGSDDEKGKSTTVAEVAAGEEGQGAVDDHFGRRTPVDVLSWLPPTPQLLADATMLLLRLTLAGVVAEDDYRWKELRQAWVEMIALQREHVKAMEGSVMEANINTDLDSSTVLSFIPLAQVAASLVVEPIDIYKGNVDPAVAKLAEGAHLMGKAMRLGGTTGDQTKDEGEDSSSEAPTPETWRKVTKVLSEAREGGPLISDFTEDSKEENHSSNDGTACHQGLLGWDMDARPLLEQGLCHAAVLSDDLESFCLARAVCSESVSIRPNSPESWWRYGVVLDRLGDEIAAEDARAASVSLGSGEGANL